MRNVPFRVAVLGDDWTRFDALLAGFSPAIHLLSCRGVSDLERLHRETAVDLAVVFPADPPPGNRTMPIPHLVVSDDDLTAGIGALEQRILGTLPSPRGPEAQLLGRSPLMAQLRGTLVTTARAGMPLLLTGENGTGKDLAAVVAHQLSCRAAEPFVAVNCGAIPSGLAETEFFGCVRGAFTGAENRPGFCQQALGGTLFLDEVGELPPETQAKLLRVFENREVRRVGSSRVETTDFRLICATNRDLSSDILAGRFREDLYYRIKVLTLRVPPLRERKEDIPLLAEHFLGLENWGAGQRVRVGAKAIGKMAGYHWPGNLRQLRNVVLRAAVLHGGPELEPHHIDWED